MKPADRRWYRDGQHEREVDLANSEARGANDALFEVMANERPSRARFLAEAGDRMGLTLEQFERFLNGDW